MRSNGYQLFKIRDGDMRPVGEPKPTLPEIEANINPPKDALGYVTYVVLPVYTNALPKADD